MAEQVPAQPTEAETSCEASGRLAAVVSNAQQLEHNCQAELRAHLLVSAYLRLSADQGGVRMPSCLSLWLACMYLGACKSIYSVSVCVCPSVRLSVGLSVCPFICAAVHMCALCLYTSARIPASMCMLVSGSSTKWAPSLASCQQTCVN